MTTFYDSFERANGSLGGNWSTMTGSPAISGGMAGGAATAAAVNTSLSDNTKIKSTCTIIQTVNDQWMGGPLVKGSGGALNGYLASVDPVGGNIALRIKAIVGGNTTTIASNVSSVSWLNLQTLSITWDAGHITATSSAGVTVEVDDSTLSGYQYAGFYCARAAYPICDCQIVTSTPSTLSVSPGVIGNYGEACTDITLIGTGTAWLSTTPSFTVDHGTLSDVAVVDDTHATATFCPGPYLGSVLFTETGMGITATALVTSDPVVVPPPGGEGEGVPLSQAASDWLDAQAEHGGLVLADNDTTDGDVQGILIKNAFGEILLGKRTASGTGEPPSYQAGVLLSVWAALWGGFDQLSISPVEPASDSVMFAIQALQTALDTLTNSGATTLDGVINAILGDDSVDNSTLMDAIGNIAPGDNQDILDAIAAMQGDPLATIKAVLDLVYGLGTTNGYDLASVKTWIESVRGTGQPTIKDVSDRLDVIQPSTAVTMSSLNTKIVPESTIQTIISAAATLIMGEEGATIAAALDLLNQIKDLIPAASAAGAPVWPGLDGVTVGEPADLDDGLIISGPMHGVLLTITGTPVRTVKYDFADVMSWSRVGQIIFGTDRGDYERSQTFSLDTQVMVPMTMAEAASAIIRLNEGWHGTVRTWVRSG